MSFLDSHLLTIIVAVPFGGALALIFFPSHQQRAIHYFARGVGLLSLLLSIYAFVAYKHQDSGYQLSKSYMWLEDLGIGWKVAVDGITVPLILLTGVVMCTGVFMSWNIRTRPKDFFVLLMLLVTGVYGVFLSLDLFFLFFFYELAVLPMYLLIGVWGSSTDFGTFIRTKEYGAMKLVLYLVAGSVLVWVALIAIWVEAGMFTFDLQVLEGATFSPTFQRVFFPFLTVGFGILAGLWPFHTWSPDGHVAAPTAVSMLHAGVLMKLGAYGILRVGIDLLPQGAQDWAPVLIVLGTINVIYGDVVAGVGLHLVLH